MRKLVIVFFTALFAVVSCSKEDPTSSVMVDLGLSVNWATCNIGAESPEEFGRFFAWGDVVGQTWDGSSWSGGGFFTTPPYRYNIDYQLEPEFDAAHVLLGEKWRMPTLLEMDELIQNCTSTWTSNYKNTGVSGRIFTSKKAGYTDKSIFLPAGGYVDGNYRRLDAIGCYWSSSYTEHNYVVYAWYLFSSSSIAGLQAKSSRYNGKPIRPVSEK